MVDLARILTSKETTYLVRMLTTARPAAGGR